MALSAQILNSGATLNFWIVVSSQDFFPGEEIRLVARLQEPATGLRYIPLATTIATFTFNKSDGTTFDKIASLNADDRSMATMDLEETETTDMIGGSVTFELDVNGDGSKIEKGVILNALRKVSTECC